MPSNDERREVAARLRDMANRRGLYGRDVFFANLIDALAMERRTSVGETLERLADLIEPSERTCTMRYYPASDLWRCSECVGATNAERTLDEPPVYCQWCGSRVIQYE